MPENCSLAGTPHWRGSGKDRSRSLRGSEAPETVALFCGVAALPAEPAFAEFALPGFDDLCSVFPCFECGKRSGRLAIEALKEEVYRWGCGGVGVATGSTRVEWIKRGRAAITQAPQEARRVELEKLVVVDGFKPPEKTLPDQ